MLRSAMVVYNMSCNKLYGISCNMLWYSVTPGLAWPGLLVGRGALCPPRVQLSAFCWPLELTFRAFVGTVVQGEGGYNRGMLIVAAYGEAVRSGYALQMARSGGKRWGTLGFPCGM